MRRNAQDAERMVRNRLPRGMINGINPIVLPEQQRPVVDMRDTNEKDGTINLNVRHA
jgi:hypothetical protein